MPVTVNVDNGQRRLTLRLDGPGRVYLNDEPVLDSDAGLTTAEFTFQPGDEVQLTAEPIEACDLFVGGEMPLTASILGPMLRFPF